MMARNFESMKEKVMEYCTKYRHQGLKPYCLGQIYDLFPGQSGGSLEPDDSLECRPRWPDKWPNAF